MTVSSRTRFLNVYPNPYSALDDQGNPCGVCPVDPTVNPRREYVGARLESAEVIERVAEGDLRHPRQYNNWVFSEEPTRVEATPYYLEKLRSRELLPADEASAKIAGFTTFLERLEQLEIEQTVAATRWSDQHGEHPAWYKELAEREAARVEKETKPPEQRVETPVAERPKGRYRNEPMIEKPEEQKS